MLRAEFQKMKRTALFWMHVFVPVVGTGIILYYYKRVGLLHMNARSIGEFTEILSLTFPALSGIVCALAVEMETEAGNMQVLLGGIAGKYRTVAVKLLALLLLAGMGTVLAIGCYVAGIWIDTGEQIPASLILFTGESIVVLLGTQLLTYVFHLFLSLKWQKGVSMGAGIVESMLGALFLTTMGDGIWMYCPFAWGTQFLRYMLYYKEKIVAKMTEDFKIGVGMSVGMTVLFTVGFFLWFFRYEGKKEVE